MSSITHYFDLEDTVKGLMWGLALGDALGKPVEFKHLWRIKEDYGPNGIIDLPMNSIWTDDTEMTFAVARALITTYKLSIETISKQIAEEFIVWLDTNTGFKPGNTCIQAVVFYKNDPKKDWWNSGIKESKGCGSAMRVAPIGLFFSEPDKLYQIAYNSSLITHAHPTALAAAVGAAYLVRLAIDKVTIKKWPELVKKIVTDIAEPGKSEFCDAIDMAEKALEIENSEEAIKTIGKGWVGEEAVAIALYCCMKYPNPEDFKDLLILSVNHDGDSDSTGCIAGGIMGAYHGYKAIGKEMHDWTTRLRERERMEEIIEEIISSLK
ncbi:MAG: ADP-ribosylglycohydrolase family protein [Candidatus Lokiarchaeota archaeon]|nr:ADP-ribosylglycohydrolase family protein [Candidatus Lokiarchaeota archaeon]